MEEVEVVDVPVSQLTNSNFKFTFQNSSLIMFSPYRTSRWSRWFASESHQNLIKSTLSPHWSPPALRLVSSLLAPIPRYLSPRSRTWWRLTTHTWRRARRWRASHIVRSCSRPVPPSSRSALTRSRSSCASRNPTAPSPGSLMFGALHARSDILTNSPQNTSELCLFPGWSLGTLPGGEALSHWWCHSARLCLEPNYARPRGHQPQRWLTPRCGSERDSVHPQFSPIQHWCRVIHLLKKN